MLFNNCKSRPHQRYGKGAFYDLNQHGQARLATDLRPGQHCCVATPAPEGKIEFAWYRFTEERRLPDCMDDPGSIQRVFFGEYLGSETLAKEEAIATEPYALFFTVNGHFKRVSAIRPSTQCVAPASLSRSECV